MIEEKATDLKSVHLVLNPKPLEAGSKFYVDVSGVRSNIKVTQKFIMMFQDCIELQGEYLRLLMAGHKSCGKSTEISIIKKELQDKFFILDINDIEKSQGEITDYADLIYFIAEELVRKCFEDENMSRRIKNQVENLKNLLAKKIFTTELLESVSSFHADASFEADTETEINLPFKKLLSFFAQLRAKTSFEKETKDKVIKEIKNTLSNFMQLLGDLILSVQEYERQKGKHFLLIIDGLDKVDKNVAESIFLSPDSPIKNMRCHMLLTFPLYLCHSCKCNQATESFSDISYLSMIKVHKQDGTDHDGITILKNVLEERMDLGLFEPNELNEPNAVCLFAIRKCGGILRDLFKMIADASLQARLEGNNKISMENMKTAYNELKNAYERSCVISDFPVFKKINDDPKKQLILPENENDSRLMDLFQRGLLIEYSGDDGGRWCDVHPAVKDILSTCTI